MLIITIIKCLVIYFFKLYYSLWGICHVDEMIEVIEASIVANLAAIIYLKFAKLKVPMEIYFIVLIIDIF